MSTSLKAAVVTGAASGIGNAISRRLLEDEYSILAVDRVRGADVDDSLNWCWHLGQMTDGAFVDGLHDACVERFGRCDVLVNNAGIIEVGTIETIDIARMCLMMRVNVEASIRCMLRFAQAFLRAGSGDIVNTSSVLGTKVRPTAGAYAATKHATEAISEALRMEISRTDVRITCVEPGLVATNLHRDWRENPRESMDIPTPLEPADVAAVVIFVLSQERRVKIPRIMVLPKYHVI